MLWPRIGLLCCPKILRDQDKYQVATFMAAINGQDSPYTFHGLYVYSFMTAAMQDFLGASFDDICKCDEDGEKPPKKK